MRDAIRVYKYSLFCYNIIAFMGVLMGNYTVRQVPYGLKGKPVRIRYDHVTVNGEFFCISH